MKKLYSLVAIAMFSATAIAQTTLLSDDFTGLAGDNTTTTGANSAWTGDANFTSVVKAYQAGDAVKIGTSSAFGSITSKTLDLSTDGGNFTVSFDVKGWTTVEGSIVVSVTGLADQTVTYTAIRTDANFESKSLTFTGGAAGSTVTISTSAKRAYIDNVKVVTVPSVLAVGDVNSTKVSLVKNTSVKNSLSFAAKANVQIVNTNGQVVKSAQVDNGTLLDVSGLAKGFYIVTGVVDGRKISQKIIKN